MENPPSPEVLSTISLSFEVELVHLQRFTLGMHCSKSCVSCSTLSFRRPSLGFPAASLLRLILQLTPRLLFAFHLGV